MNNNNEKLSRLKTLYTNRKKGFENQWKKQKRNLNQVSWFRLLFFIFLIVLVYLDVKSGFVLWYIATFFFLIAFFELVKLSAKIVKKRDHFRALTDLNQDELLALDGKYNSFEDGKEFLKREHPFIWDLDLFGQQSVFQSINRSFTYRGKNKLASFFSDLDRKSVV